MRITDNIQTRYRPFIVKFHGPGYKRGSRFTIHDLRHGTRKTIELRDDLSGGSVDQAAVYLVGRGITVDALALYDFPVNGANTEVILLSADFATPLK